MLSATTLPVNFMVGSTFESSYIIKVECMHVRRRCSLASVHIAVTIRVDVPAQRDRS